MSTNENHVILQRFLRESEGKPRNHKAPLKETQFLSLLPISQIYAHHQDNTNQHRLSRFIKGVSIGILSFVKDVNSISPPAAQSMCFDLGAECTRYVLNVVLLSWMNRNRLLIPNTRTGTGYCSFFSGI